MEQVVNNTDEIKHLPYGGVTLFPGKNEMTQSQIEANQGHPGFEADLEADRIEIPFLETVSENEDKEKEKTGNNFPKRTGPSSSWYELSNGEKIQGEDQAIEAQKELNEEAGEG